ncbi:MAG TPA: hypothetical protein VEZ90_11160, partial [Blastocatellia bacterium]|nr:hypothetical protein [Blastocatellia bacterium]
MKTELGLKNSQLEDWSSYGFGPNAGPGKDRAPEADLLVSSDFLRFLAPFHREFTPRQRELVGRRSQALKAAHEGAKPAHPAVTDAVTAQWNIEVPEWCVDQRNQMTGPADDAELVVKMLNSGAPGVMLDLEDSTANFWPNLVIGI